MTPAPDTLIALLRHGETQGGNCYRGSRDDPLTALGWEQMEAAAGALAWERIVASPLKRCADFAQALASRLAIPLAFDERLREMHFGAWEGRTAAELMESAPDALARFWRDPAAYPPPGAEALGDFQARVLAAWDELRNQPNGRRVLVVGHGGPSRTILCTVLGHPLERLLELEIDLGHGALRWLRLRSDGGAELLEGGAPCVRS